jgi:chromosome segregation ATPase
MVNSEHKDRNTDANFLQSLISEAQAESDAKEILNSIKDHLPELKQYYKDLVTAQEAFIKTRTEMQEQLQWHRNSIKQLNKWYSDTFYKIDSINSHIDKVVVEASKKLVVTVSVSKADRVAIQADHDRWIQEMNAIHNRDLKELNEKYERERQNRRDMLNGGDGMYLSGFMYWIGCAFFWFGVSALFVLVYCLIR